MRPVWAIHGWYTVWLKSACAVNADAWCNSSDLYNFSGHVGVEPKSNCKAKCLSDHPQELWWRTVFICALALVKHIGANICLSARALLQHGLHGPPCAPIRHHSVRGTCFSRDSQDSFLWLTRFILVTHKIHSWDRIPRHLLICIGFVIILGPAPSFRNAMTHHFPFPKIMKIR